jgi:hypothetical protein
MTNTNPAPGASENHAIDTLKVIAGLIGNVDHSKGNGANSAKLRGDLLNHIRTMALDVLAHAHAERPE